MFVEQEVLLGPWTSGGEDTGRVSEVGVEPHDGRLTRHE